MKKIIILILTIVLISCTKEEEKQTKFKVSPSGTDDTQALIDAFDQAIEAGPESTVQLGEGVFKVSFIEIHDFHGNFMGAGKDKTAIQNISKLPSVSGFYEDNIMPFLINFVGGEVSISKMTIKSTDGPLCPDDPYKILEALLALLDYTGQYVPPQRNIIATVEDVDFICGKDNTNSGVYGDDHNVNMILYAGSNINVFTESDPNSSVDLTVRNCLFDHGGLSLDLFALGENSKVVFENNTVRNCLYSIGFIAVLGAKVDVKNNTFSKSILGTLIDDNDYGLLTNNQALVQRTEYNIFGNEFECDGGTTGLNFVDTRRTQRPDEGFPQSLNIQNNFFTLSNDGIAIFGLNTYESLIQFNNFTGSGKAAIYLDGDTVTNTYAEKNSITVNSFTNTTFSDAAVILGKLTKNCNAGDNSSSQKIIDLGENNTVTGFISKLGEASWNPRPFSLKKGSGIPIQRIN